MTPRSGEPCKHMLALFDLMTVGNLTFHNGDYAESGPTIECSNPGCLEWSPASNQWHSLESDIPGNLTT